MTDWGQAGIIGAVGFATVFVVLAVLSITVALTGRAIGRLHKEEEKPRED